MSGLSRDEFTAAMRQAVADKGRDYTYPEAEKNPLGICRYRFEGHPSCLIGHALDILGVVVPPGQEGNGARRVLEVLGMDDEEAPRAAALAQGFQDKGHTWGFALDAYLGELDELDKAVAAR